ncbi:hypothetical protein [Vibrio owensii]|uniref:hypothetical protein n=1 Tax=Vibrio owensii TaxID=696485 RepID=UPI003DA06C36
MNNFKKAALASLVFAAIGTAQAADPQATVVWSGVIPDASFGDTLLITGLNGDLSAQTGALTPNADGTFNSETIVLEARNNDGSVDTPVVGDLVNADWTIANSAISYDGVSLTDAVLEVAIDGTQVVDTAAAATGVQTIGLSVAQASPLSDVGGSTVQASVTVLAKTAL